MVRRFGALNARIALSMQDDIVQLEKELDDIDNILSQKSESRMIHNDSFWKDTVLFKERDELVKKKIPEALMRYSRCNLHMNELEVCDEQDAFINGYTQLVNRPPVDRDDLATVKRWMLKLNPKAIHPDEEAFINCDDDFIGIQPSVRSWNRNILDATALLRIPEVLRLFAQKPRDRDLIKEATTTLDEKEGTRWANDKRIERLSTFVIAVLGLDMLVGPLCWLAFVNGLVHRLSIITGFIVFFFILVEVTTSAGLFNALAAAAAYSAVLMAFLQINPA